jgi:glutathionyl-hydroquinone reductase
MFLKDDSKDLDSRTVPTLYDMNHSGVVITNNSVRAKIIVFENELNEFQNNVN